jgi:hypothetical protein
LLKRKEGAQDGSVYSPPENVLILQYVQIFTRGILSERE